MLVRRGDEGFALYALLLLLRVVEDVEVPEYGGRGRDRRAVLLPPAALVSPPLTAAHRLRLYPGEDPAKALVLLKDPYVVHRVSACKVEEDEGGDDLLVRPALGLHVQMGTDVIPQTEH